MNKFLLLPLLLAIFHVSAAEFAYDPPKNFTLSYRMIALHHPVTTKSEAAQLYFDQGLSLLYAFNHDAAYWSFLKASEADPNIAMAYWGMAIVLGKNINMSNKSGQEEKAFQLVQKGIQLSDRASKSERDYLLALSKRYSNQAKPNFDQLTLAYRQAMKELYAKYPDDPDAAVLYAESIMDVSPWGQWGPDGKPLEGTIELLSVLESVLKQVPDHLGANHYYIHAMEASQHPEKALAAANKLPSLFPFSGHILHMPSHIYLLIGDYHKAVLANEEAVAVDRTYLQNYGDLGNYPIHYLSHNLYFLSRAYSMEGNFVRAKETADELQKLYAPHFQRMPDLEYYVPTSLFVFLRFNHWQDILETAEPPKEMQTTQVIWHFSRAIAYCGLGNVSEALKEQQLFEKGARAMPTEFVYGYNKAVQFMAVADKVLKAKIQETQGDPQAALDTLKEAVSLQDLLHYNEPPDWYFPVRESLGGLLLREKRYAEAEKVFRDDLNLHPRNGRSLFGLKEALKIQSKQDNLYWVEQEFQKAWMYSDTSLSISQI